jgi:hypothetical protein
MPIAGEALQHVGQMYDASGQDCATRCLASIRPHRVDPPNRLHRLRADPLLRAPMHHFAVKQLDVALHRVTQPDSGPHDGVEHRLDVGR